MKKLLILATLGWASATWACRTPTLADFTVYAKESIRGVASDYLGLTGAGQNVGLTDFFIQGREDVCLGLASGQSTEVVRGEVREVLEAGGNLGLRNAHAAGGASVRGQVQLFQSAISKETRSPARPVLNASGATWKRGTPDLRVNHTQFAQSLDQWSRQLSMLPNTLTFSANNPSLRLQDRISVVTIDGTLLAANQQLVIQGDATQYLIVNVRGLELAIVHHHVVLTGGVKPQNIYWNFMEARELRIQNTGNAQYGMPGIIVAPYANLRFYEALVEGALYVRNVVFDDHVFGILKSGQVNGVILDPAAPQPGGVCPPVAPPPPVTPPPAQCPCNCCCTCPPQGR